MDRICECKKVRCEFRNKLSTHSFTTYTQMFGHKRNVISSNKVYSSYIHKKHYTTKYGWMVKAPVITPVTTVTKTQLITSRKSGVHTASTVFSGLGAGATCTVSLKARQTDYDWKRTEWLSIRSSGKKYKMLNTNCGFTKQCSHAYQTCKLGYTTVLADSAGRVTIHATQSNGVNYCAYNGYYMYASVTLTCKYSKSSYLKCPHKKTKQMGYLTPVSKAKCPVNGNLPRCNEVGCGQLCEGDGECGTNQQLNQCNPGMWDIYKRMCTLPANKVYGSAYGYKVDGHNFKKMCHNEKSIRVLHSRDERKLARPDVASKCTRKKSRAASCVTRARRSRATTASSSTSASARTVANALVAPVCADATCSSSTATTRIPTAFANTGGTV